MSILFWLGPVLRVGRLILNLLSAVFFCFSVMFSDFLILRLLIFREASVLLALLMAILVIGAHILQNSAQRSDVIRTGPSKAL